MWRCINPSPCASQYCFVICKQWPCLKPFSLVKSYGLLLRNKHSNKKLFRDIFADHNISVMRIEGNRRSICLTTKNSQCSVNAKKMRKMKNFYATVILIRLKRISKFAFRGVLSLRYLFIRLFCYREYHPIQLKLLN